MKNWLARARDRVARKSYFHLHLISDSTGTTLATIARAAAAQYTGWRAVEHATPMVTDESKLDAALDAVDSNPGIVLYTMVDQKLADRLSARCAQLGVPSVNVLAPLTQAFDSHLGETMSGKAGAQHALDEDYFGRLEALRFAMVHDDGNLPPDMEMVDIVLLGISRTSKTPTSIYLAQRGLRVANIPLVMGSDVPETVFEARNPLIVGLIATADRILQVRQNRLLAFENHSNDGSYVDRAAIIEELSWTRRLCSENNWPLIDVSRRSVEETAAAILALRQHAP